METNKKEYKPNTMFAIDRAYGALGTEGYVYYESVEDITRKMTPVPICVSLELLWKDNKRSISCIPEGIYPLVKRFTEKRGWHVMIDKVPNRSWILVHAAANVLAPEDTILDIDDNDIDLMGCVSMQTSTTKAVTQNKRAFRLSQFNSRGAVAVFNTAVFDIIDKQGEAYIRIFSSAKVPSKQ